MNLDDIKFRGKVSYDEDRWVYGSLARDLHGTYLILPNDWAKGAIVIPDTISQYTGYKVGDIEVYEGDTLIVKNLWPENDNDKGEISGVVIGVGEHAKVKFSDPHAPLYSLRCMASCAIAVIPPTTADLLSKSKKEDADD